MTDVQFRPSVDYRLAMELSHHEAVIRQAYKDSAGVWTWSVGLTNATGHKVERYINNPQPMQRCMDIYVWALKNYARQVDKVFEGFELDAETYAGAVSFHWNTGAIGKTKWVDYWKADLMARAEVIFKSWNKSGGRVVDALVDRRNAEADLIFRKKWSSDGKMTEYTKLTASHRPIWSSAVKTDVRHELLVAFGANVEPVLDDPAKPDNIPSAPTLTAA